MNIFTAVIFLIVGVSLVVIIGAGIPIFIASRVTGMKFRRIIKSIKKEDEKDLKKDELSQNDKILSFFFGALLGIPGGIYIQYYFRGHNQIVKFDASKNYIYGGILCAILFFGPIAKELNA